MGINNKEEEQWLNPPVREKTKREKLVAVNKINLERLPNRN